MALIDHHEPDPGQEWRIRSLPIRQHRRMDGVGVGEYDVRMLANVGTARVGGIAINDADADMIHEQWMRIDQGKKLGVLILRQSLGGIDNDGGGSTGDSVIAGREGRGGDGINIGFHNSGKDR